MQAAINTQHGCTTHDAHSKSHLLRSLDRAHDIRHQSTHDPSALSHTVSACCLLGIEINSSRPAQATQPTPPKIFINPPKGSSREIGFLGKNHYKPRGLRWCAAAHGRWWGFVGRKPTGVMGVRGSSGGAGAARARAPSKEPEVKKAGRRHRATPRAPGRGQSATPRGPRQRKTRPTMVLGRGRNGSPRLLQCTILNIIGWGGFFSWEQTAHPSTPPAGKLGPARGAPPKPRAARPRYPCCHMQPSLRRTAPFRDVRTSHVGYGAFGV